MVIPKEAIIVRRLLRSTGDSLDPLISELSPSLVTLVSKVHTTYSRIGLVRRHTPYEPYEVEL